MAWRWSRCSICLGVLDGDGDAAPHCRTFHIGKTGGRSCHSSLMGQAGATDTFAGHFSSHILEVLLRPLRAN